MFDVIIRGGTVIDGLGSKRFASDVGISGDRITAVDTDLGPGHHEIDATNLIVAPGFIDTHTHSDGWMLRRPSMPAKLAQGFTTEFLMLDGIGYAPVNDVTWREWFYYLRSLNGLRLTDYEGWQTFEEYMLSLDQRNLQNAAAFLPYANVRSLVSGFGRTGLDDFQRLSVAGEIQRGMEQGALGISTGLDYIVQCFADTEELVSACRAMAEFDGIYVTHIRYKLGLMAGLEEAADISRRSGVRLHISHLKSPGPEQTDAILGLIDEFSRDIDLSFDVYPYQSGSTMLSYLLPYDVWTDGPLAAIAKLQRPEIRHRFGARLRHHRLPLSRLRIAGTLTSDGAQYEGMRLDEYVELTGQTPEDALCDLLIEERLSVLLVIDEGPDEWIKPLLQHEKFMLGSDGIYFDDAMIHPRNHGSAARLIGRAVRDWKLFTLEDAVYKLSGSPATRFGLTDRGFIRENAFADLAIFSAEEVNDPANYDEPQLLSSGMRHVLVNGQIVWPDEETGLDTEGLPGRFLTADV
ncbi:MAG TPA: D-aminoacylase [Planctomycetaceae bacterium]|nr:D-aminoacylase [Planctomycetaceae bacterium]